MWNAVPTKSIINRYTLPLTLAIDICDEHRHSTSSFATPGIVRMKSGARRETLGTEGEGEMTFVNHLESGCLRLRFRRSRWAMCQNSEKFRLVAAGVAARASYHGW